MGGMFLFPLMYPNFWMLDIVNVTFGALDNFLKNSLELWSKVLVFTEASDLFRSYSGSISVNGYKQYYNRKLCLFI